MSFNLNLLYAFDVRTNTHDALRKTELCKRIREFPKKLFVNSEGRTFSYIAYRLYGDQEFWPVLCELNDVIDPFIVPDVLYIIPDTDLKDMISKYGGR